MHLVETQHRAELERDLRAAAYVPLTITEHPVSSMNNVLPSCTILEKVAGPRHGRLLWAHPGRSGLDPRALLPLAVVRVCDGVEPALASALHLRGAVRWLLETPPPDLRAWLEGEHQVLIGSRDTPCTIRSTGRCLQHPDTPVLERTAAALSGRPFRCATTDTDEPATAWPYRVPADLASRVRPFLLLALAAATRLGALSASGVYGAAAWDVLTGHRDDRLVLPPLSRKFSTERRGINGYGAWRSGRLNDYFRCDVCNALWRKPPCLDCQTAGRDESPKRFTSSVFQRMPVAHPTMHDVVRPLWQAPCGVANCRTARPPFTLTIERASR